jgi:alcohol dehydrogenase class IV
MAVHLLRFPVQIVFGEGSLEEIRSFIRSFGKHALVVTGDGPTASMPVVDTLRGILTREGISVSLFSEVKSDPDVETVERGVTKAREEGCDFVIGFGGGSPMDAAKVIAARLNNEGDIASWEGVGRVPGRAKPLVCIPTTSGTGSEVTWVAVISGGKRGQKMSIVSQYLYPVLAIVDPCLTYTMPPELTAATGMDALTHAVESHVSRRAWEPTRAFSLKAAGLASAYLERACQDGSDTEARHCMSLASLLAGMAFTASGLGLAHALSHALGARFGIPHGVANAVLLPHVMRFNLPAAPEAYRELAAAMGMEISGLSSLRAAEKAVEAVEGLLAALPLPRNLGDLGVPASSVESLAAEAFLNTRMRSSNPRETVLEDLIGILREALG